MPGEPRPAHPLAAASEPASLPPDYLEFKLHNPVVTNFLDTESIVFYKYLNVILINYHSIRGHISREC